MRPQRSISATFLECNEECALDLTPAGDQVVYQDDHCHHDQDVNQIATEVTDEPE